MADFYSAAVAGICSAVDTRQPPPWRAALAAQILDLLRGGGPRRVAGQALLAGFQKFLRPAVIQVLHDPFATAQLGDAVLTTQAGQHNADLLLRRKLAARGATDLFDDLFRRSLPRRVLLSHLRSFTGDDGLSTLSPSTRLFCLTGADAGQSIKDFGTGPEKE